MPALTTLTQIRTKIRRLTRSVSPAQITDAQIDEYINTFVLYDFPANIKLDYLMSSFSFYTVPQIDTYTTDTVPELVDFKNKYISVGMPVYIEGNKAFYTQSRDQFFKSYPMITPLRNLQLSNGTATYTGLLIQPPAIPGTIPTSNVLRGTINLSMVNAIGTGFIVHDTGVSDPITGLGTLVGAGTGFVDYTTSAFSVTFNDTPAVNTWVQASYYNYQPAIPDTVLFYDTEFFLRPVPNGAYKVTLNCFIRPTQLLATNDVPDLVEWAQYIAFGASKKIYEDRFDWESVAALMPAFKEQEALCLRRTLMQQKDQRAATIFNTDQSNSGNFWWNSWI
jgi:hypothetical protein